MKRFITLWILLAALLLCFVFSAAGGSGVESLTVTGGELDSLEALSSYPNLRSLTLLDCPAYDLAPLKSCSHLTALTIRWSDGYTGGGTYDLAPLKKCQRLNTLTLIGQGIGDLSALTGIAKLTSLTVESTAVSDYSPITKLGLKHLRLFGADVESVTAVFLGVGRNLESASVGDCTLTPEANDAVLAGTRLISLSFTGAEGIDGSSARWAKLINLTSLTITGGSVSGLEFCDTYVSTVAVKLTDVQIGGAKCSVDFDKYFLKASGVPQAEMLKLVRGSGRRWQYATVRNRDGQASADVIAAFADASALLSLDVQAVAADAFTPDVWEGFAKLEQLKLSDCTAVSLDMLIELPGLRRLSVQNAAVSGAETIAGLRKLDQLSLIGCAVEDWSFLDALGSTQLTVLNLSGCNGPGSLLFVKDLAKLKVLALEYAPVTDLSPLTGLDVTSLYLYGCEIRDYAPLQTLKALARLYCNAGAALPALTCRVVYSSVIVEE